MQQQSRIKAAAAAAGAGTNLSRLGYSKSELWFAFHLVHCFSGARASMVAPRRRTSGAFKCVRCSVGPAAKQEFAGEQEQRTTQLATSRTELQQERLWTSSATEVAATVKSYRVDSNRPEQAEV